MTVYGYIKRDHPVATSEQLAAIVSYDCTELFIEDKGFGPATELGKLLTNITLNDQLVIYDLRAIWAERKTINALLEELTAKNIHLVSINNNLDTKVKKTFFDDVLLVMKAEEEYRSYFIKQRIEQARLEGKKHGRPQVDKEVIEKIKFLFESKKMSMREISKICNVSLGTVHKYAKKEMNVVGEPTERV